jgi:hypothetical protein
MSDVLSELESLSRPTSRNFHPSVRPWRFRFSDESRLRFFSSRGSDADWAAWYPVEKANGKLQSFLHYALPDDDRKEPGVDIIACHSNAQDGVIGMTETHFRLINDHDIPLSNIGFFEEKGQHGHCVRWKDDKPQVLYIWWHAPAAFIHEISCCVRVDLDAQSTTAVYFDRNEDRIQSVFTHMLLRTGDCMTAPFQVLLRLLSEYAAGSESWRLLIDGRIRLLEGETGARSQKLELEPDKSHGFNFGGLTMSMQNSNTGLVSLEHVVNWQILVNEFMLEIWDLYVQLLRERLPSVTISSQQRWETHYELQNQSKANALRQRRVIGAQKRMQSQISILLSLISQRDNRVNILLAQESREIAAAAKYDSKVMRIIAILTLFFLPATLIATIFSSGIFNLGDLGEDGKRISPLWWVYALTSLLSTGIVMVGGFLFLRTGVPANNGNGRAMSG